MSLIEEALRRVRDPLLPVEPPQAPAAHAPNQLGVKQHSAAAVWQAQDVSSSATASSPLAAHSLIVVAVTVVAFTGALIAGGAFWMGQRLDGRSQATPSQVGAQTEPVHVTATEDAAVSDEDSAASSGDAGAVTSPLAVAVAVTPAATSLSAPHNLVLNGVVEGSGEPYAVINGSIVGLGDTVEGSTLSEIANGSAKLRRADGAEVVLRVSRQ